MTDGDDNSIVPVRHRLEGVGFLLLGMVLGAAALFVGLWIAGWRARS